MALGLFAEYLELGGENQTIDGDDRRSLRYFVVELAYRAGRTADEHRQRIVDWVESLLQFESFTDREGRLPRENNRLPREAISDEERESAEWARYQRRPSTRSQHCRYQTRRLEIIPDFSWNPQEDKWIAQFTDYFHFFAAHGAPAIRSRNPDERRRAAWAARQRLAHAKGTLPPARSAKLEATRLWTWTTGAAPNAT